MTTVNHLTLSQEIAQIRAESDEKIRKIDADLAENLKQIDAEYAEFQKQDEAKRAEIEKRRAYHRGRLEQWDRLLAAKAVFQAFVQWGEIPPDILAQANAHGVDFVAACRGELPPAPK